MSKMTDLILEQMETLAKDKDRIEEECKIMRTHIRELRWELDRLSDLERCVWESLSGDKTS